MIIQNTRASGKTDLTFTVPKADYKTALEIEKKVAQDIEAEDVFGDENIAKVSVTGVGCAATRGWPRACSRPWPGKASTS